MGCSCPGWQPTLWVTVPTSKTKNVLWAGLCPHRLKPAPVSGLRIFQEIVRWNEVLRVRLWSDRPGVLRRKGRDTRKSALAFSVCVCLSARHRGWLHEDRGGGPVKSQQGSPHRKPNFPALPSFRRAPILQSVCGWSCSVCSIWWWQPQLTCSGASLDSFGDCDKVKLTSSSLPRVLGCDGNQKRTDKNLISETWSKAQRDVSGQKLH